MTDLHTRPARPVGGPPGRGLLELGHQIRFYVQAAMYVPRAVTRHRNEVLRLLAIVSFGRGALAVIGGTVVVVAFLTAFTGIELGIQGYTQLGDIGVEALSGFVSAYVNTRLAAPFIAGIALIATVGAGFTAQLGAMRVSEEIDALEAMAVPSMAYLVSSRIVAGLVAILPLYAVGLICSYLGTRLIVTQVYGQSGGSYDHYFYTFLQSRDIVASFVIVLVGAMLSMAIHCYYGYYATGGPAGVGQAVGRAVRLSLIAVLSSDLVLSLAFFGATDTLHISAG